jgi:two-component system, OmpR family, sensor histidine kinase KdpD
VSEHRPDPDALLARVQAEQARGRRGKLKVFLGAAAGVGKTYAMLETARGRGATGLDVVVGYVEPHGRPETEALLEGLERLPPRVVEYRGTVLREFDLDAALARRPALILVDELAHTNAPGARHERRWQDVMELRDAGIDVYTTVNIQHLESLNDVVARITGITVRETVPDSVLESADEVELIDLPPDELIQRLREGKVYVPPQADRAVQKFFRKGNPDRRHRHGPRVGVVPVRPALDPRDGVSPRGRARGDPARARPLDPGLRAECRRVRFLFRPAVFLLRGGRYRVSRDLRSDARDRPGH